MKKETPGIRIGQFIYNATGGEDIFHIEDDMLVKMLENYLER